MSATKAHRLPDPLPSLRVLVLDDEEPIRILLETILSDAGFHVETAAHGRAGLQVLLQRDFDVAIVDLKMAVMDGAEFLAEARSIWPWLGMIILSGYVTEADVAHARRFGVTRILNKPVQPAKLIQEIREEAEAKRQRVESSASRSLDRIQEQMAILRRFSESAMAAARLDEAIHSVTTGLSHLLPCSAIGVLHVEGEQNRMFVHCFKPVHPDFVRALEREMLGRYRALTGQVHLTAPPATLLGEVMPDDGGLREVLSSLTVPILNARNMRGLLSVAYADVHDPSRTDTAFIYHAANHLSTVLSALGRMRELSVHDALTGVYNRRGLQEEYERAWQLARRYSYPIGVAMIDIDHFKTLNDAHGHPVGDEVLKEFSALVQRVARATDIIGRLGGDEMIVILQQAGPSDSITFAERLCDAARRTIFCESSKALALTASVGVASISAHSKVDTAEGMIAMADRALYAAKQAGRDRVCIFQPSMLETATVAAPAPAAVEPEREGVKRRGRVMIVDDDESVGQVVKAILTKSNYDVNVFTSALAAIERLSTAPGQFDVLITDLSMPELSGFDLLDRLRSVDDALVKIVITGNATMDNAIASLRRGAYDFIEKPIQPKHLTAVVDRAVEYSRLKAENRRYQNNLEDMVREKSAALREALDEIRASYDFTLEAMVGMLDARERSTGQHSIRVRLLAIILARELGLSQAEVDEISHGALLHDIGKIAVPDAILLKPDKLTSEERDIMKKHPEVGHRLLAGSKYLERASSIVLQHQEAWDGSGYPAGLKGKDITLGARIFAVVDTYDAMRSDRIYRKALPPETAAEEIRRHAGTQFDPDVVTAFLRCQSELERAGNWPAS